MPGGHEEYASPLTPKADARTRTGDPFITRDGPVSRPVVSSCHTRCKSSGNASRGTTADDNLVYPWYTPNARVAGPIGGGLQGGTWNCWLQPDARNEAS
jgi:hypothetical protein